MMSSGQTLFLKDRVSGPSIISNDPISGAVTYQHSPCLKVHSNIYHSYQLQTKYTPPYFFRAHMKTELKYLGEINKSDVKVQQPSRHFSNSDLLYNWFQLKVGFLSYPSITISLVQI